MRFLREIRGEFRAHCINFSRNGKREPPRSRAVRGQRSEMGNGGATGRTKKRFAQSPVKRSDLDDRIYFGRYFFSKGTGTLRNLYLSFLQLRRSKLLTFAQPSKAIRDCRQESHMIVLALSHGQRIQTGSVFVLIGLAASSFAAWRCSILIAGCMVEPRRNGRHMKSGRRLESKRRATQSCRQTPS
jgi:hypothetical protein